MEIYDARDFLDENKKESTEKSEIQTFYTNKVIFLTGASGFVGILVLEKLLRTCKDLRKVYVLFRSSRTKQIRERLVEYFNDPVFDRMKHENPTYYKQVTCIQGDLSLDQLGLSAEDRQAIIDNTQVIFHVAATVKFDEHLADAYNINVKGTKSLIQMAEQMKQLQGFVYVSTAYSNCDRKHIEEKFYKPVFTDEETMTILSNSGRYEQALILPHILDRKPNTYIFTKTICEDLVRKLSDHLPIVVVRPSIVMPTLAEPYSYYSNDKNSLLGLMGGGGIGLIRVGCCGPDTKVDLVPADATVNCILAVGWHRAITPDSPKVYNCVGYESEVELKKFVDINEQYLKDSKETVDIVLWKVHSVRVESTFLLYFLYYLLHILPGLFFSLAERYQNRKPMIMKIYRKFFFLEKTIRYFVSYDWSFTNDNTRSVLRQLNSRDQELFNFNMKDIDWFNSYSSVLYRCICIYTLKAHDSYPKELYKKKMKFIDPIDKAIIWGPYVGLVYFCYRIICNLLSYGGPISD